MSPPGRPVLRRRGGPAANKQRSPRLPGPSPPPPPTAHARLRASASWILGPEVPNTWPLPAGAASQTARARRWSGLLQGLVGNTREGHPGSHPIRPAALPNLFPAYLSFGGADLRRLPAASRQACQVLSLHPNTLSPWRRERFDTSRTAKRQGQHPRGLKSSALLCPRPGNATRAAVPFPKVQGRIPGCGLPLCPFLQLLISPGFISIREALPFVFPLKS